MSANERGDVGPSGDYGTMSEPIELHSIPGDYNSSLAAGASNIDQPKTAQAHIGRTRKGPINGNTDRSSIRVHSAKGSEGLVLKQQLNKGVGRNGFLEQMGLSTVDPPRTAGGNFMGARNRNKEGPAMSSNNNDRFTSTSTANGPRQAIGLPAAAGKRPPSGRIFTGSKDL